MWGAGGHSPTVQDLGQTNVKAILGVRLKAAQMIFLTPEVCSPLVAQQKRRVSRSRGYQPAPDMGECSDPEFYKDTSPMNDVQLFSSPCACYSDQEACRNPVYPKGTLVHHSCSCQGSGTGLPPAPSQKRPSRCVLAGLCQVPSRADCLLGPLPISRATFACQQFYQTAPKMTES